MIWALINDLLQRLVTFNKGPQRRHLSLLLTGLRLARGRRALDFGCGTALFAPVFTKHGLHYHGYDIDPRLLRYAARLYPECAFVSRAEDLSRAAPFDLIVANCCFHHIHDEPLAAEVARVRDLLADDGVFLLIDLANDGAAPWLKRTLLKLDQGVNMRSSAGYRQLLESAFVIDQQTVWPQPFGPWGTNPLVLDLVIFQCRKK